ncbi:STAS domain-containing protein [Undibacterium sp. Jales W-56]|uniref:SulP family inorganic anion transporter n=1 Tax=Undibacterium sp. Jales W-56 TaxID=2897325 RepID=UPI0021CFF8F5|nr:SulP family inorganic anion transporter [Undibacterium sp. Jales W-56]MCU6435478.1 STAS domain-containing protein [Undibacterium sp. Jales W-56]
MKNTSLWTNVIAGLSLAGLLLPEAVAYSSIANLPAQAGIVALFAGLFCYGVIGSSRYAIVAATSSSAAVLASASAAMANGDNSIRLAAAIGLVMLTGIFFVMAGLFKLGSISDFIAKPVLRGFAFGLASIIIIKQAANVLHIHLHHSDIIRILGELFGQVHDWNLVSGGIGLAALVLLFIFARIPGLPGGLIVIILSILIGKWIDLSQYGVGYVGEINLHLETPSLPRMSYPEWLRIGEMSIAMVMILYAESYSSIRNFAMKHGDQVSPNRDLLALGFSNVISGLFHGMPVGAGFSATSANEANGATSRLAGWVALMTLLVIVLTLLPMIALTPEPVLAAIVIHAVSHTLRLSIFYPYFTLHRDRLVVIAAVIAVLLLGVLDGLLVAIGVSLLMLLRKLSESTLSILGRLKNGHDFVSKVAYPDAKSIPGILILRPESGLFFANAERILALAKNYIAIAGDDAKVTILSLEESPDLDSSSVEAIIHFCEEISAKNTYLFLARLKIPAQQVLIKAGIHTIDKIEISDLSVDDMVQMAEEKCLVESECRN